MNDSTLLDYICSAGGPTYCTGPLDLKIYRAVESGISTFAGVCTACGCNSKEKALRGQTPEWRRIDRRMQWLKKKRFLSYNRNKGWKALDPKKSEGAA